MARPRRTQEFETKLLELILSTLSIAQIAEKLGRNRATISSALGPLYEKYGITGNGAGKRYRLLAKMRPQVYRARHGAPGEKAIPERKPAYRPLDGLDWETRFWIAYKAICELERLAEDDGAGNNKYFRQAVQ